MNKRELKAEIVRFGDNCGDLAEALGISRQTLSNKMSGNNAQFTQNEINTMKERYNLSPVRITEIFFSE